VLEEGCVALPPFARLSELPTVDDVAVEDELVATVVLQEPNGLTDMGVLDAQMDVGQDDGTIMSLQGYSFIKSP
jgi:hypothetical protein